MPDFSLEKENHYKNIFMVGIDEAGRGSWAGPIVATACWIDYKNYTSLPLEINDSKKLSSHKRKKIILSLNKNVKYSTGISTAKEIDNYGLTIANFMAMKRALYCLTHCFNNKVIKKFHKINVYVDGKYTPNFSNIDITSNENKIIKLPVHNIYSIVKGDSKSKTIALASVIAKETRDSIMRNYSLKYPEYNFNNHFGYGTAKHNAALSEFGVLSIHRKSFKPIKTIYS